MRDYLELLIYLKAIFDSDPNVNTVVSGDETEIDIYDKNIMPVVHINITDSPFVGQQTTAVSQFNVTVGVYELRDKNREEDRDKYWYNDNRHDNWNLTYAILRLGQNKLVKNYLSNDVGVVSASAAQKESDSRENGLDGWIQQFTLNVPDEFTAICNPIEVTDTKTTGTPPNVTEIKLTMSVMTILNTGQIRIYDSGDTLIETFTEADMTMTNYTLTINTVGSAMENPSAGDYYGHLDEGLLTYNDYNFQVHDDTSINFTI